MKDDVEQLVKEVAVEDVNSVRVLQLP
jgi:hypothetical protein